MTSANQPATLDHTALQGKRVMMTRAQEQAADFERQLQAVGAIPLAFPTIQIVPPTDQYVALDDALAQVSSFDWAVFTSVNGVHHVWYRLDALGIETTAMSSLRLAAIGPATAEALVTKGLEVEVIPDRYVAEALLDAIPSPAGQRFLLPRADIARDALRVGLQTAGAEVVEVPAYHTVQVTPSADALGILDDGVDFLTFTASSTAHHFIDQVGIERAQALAEQAQVVAIGPITAKTAPRPRTAR